MLQELLDKLKQSKLDLEKHILEDGSLSKFEKLSLLEKHEIWGDYGYIAHPFQDWELENVAAEKASGILAGKSEKDYHCAITDQLLVDDYSNRGSRISFVTYIEGLLDDNEDLSTELAVVTNRGDCRTETKKTLKEIINRIFEFCYQHKVTGFIFDW